MLLSQYLAIAFVMMFIPFIHIIIAIKGKKDVDPLPVNLDYSKDPRFMANRFEKYFFKAFEKTTLEVSHIYHDDKFGTVEVLNQQYNDKKYYKGMVYILDEIEIAQKSTISHEILSEASVTLLSNCKVRAIKSKHSITLHKNSQVQRWVDAGENVYVGKDSCLNIVCATKRIVLAQGTQFKRLYAHPIQSSHERKDPIHEPHWEKDEVTFSDIKDNVLYLSTKRPFIDQDTTVSQSIVSKYSLTLKKNVRIEGNVKSNANLHLDENCIIMGNLFSEGDISISENCFIMGNVFSHKNIYISKGSQIATATRTKSVIAKGIISIEEGVSIFSYVLADNYGEIV